MAEPASELQMAKERIGKLNARMKEARRVAETTTDGAERRRQLERLRILKDMYKDCREEIARLEGRILAEQKSHLHIDAVFNTNRVWSDLRGMTWGSLDVLTWSDIMQARDGAQTGHQRQLLIDLMNDSLRSCTERQRAYIHAYYSQQLVQDEIAEEFGVNKSSVSRVIKRGLAHVAHHVVARLFIARCVENGTFDYIKFVQSTKVLTERQTELLYLSMTQDASYTMMAAYIGRNQSTVSRCMNKVEHRLRTLRIDFLPEANPNKIRFRDWARIDEKTLAERLGLSRKFYYQTMLRGKRIQGVPLMHYHILYLLRTGWSEKEAAEEMGCSETLCKKVGAMYQEIPVYPNKLPQYNPDKVMRGGGAPGGVMAALRDLTRGSDEVIDRIDAQTPQRLREVGAC